MKTFSGLAYRLALAVVLTGLLSFAANEAFAQARRPAKVQRQIQKKLDKQGAKKLVETSDSASVDPKPSETSVKDASPQPQKHSLDGVRERGILGGFFTREETQMVIPGFGNPAALLVLLRQLDLTPAQKESFKALRFSIGNKLARLQNEKRQAENQLEEALYGEQFNPQRVEELAAKSADLTSEIIKTQANIESQFRQILTPDQFFVFRFLIGELVLPQRRLTPQQIRQQQLRRQGLNQPNRPNQVPPDYDQ
ncbi:MAG: Spy/CpxP family protein refolding chaperone [Blastocatellales bacterium]